MKILKRIIVGVAIGTILMLIKSSNVFAYDAETYYIKFENVENYVLEHIPNNDKWKDFDLNNYPYVLVELVNGSNNNKGIMVFFFKSLDQFNSLYIEKNQYGISIKSGTDYCGYTYYSIKDSYYQDLGCKGGSGGYISTYFSTNYNYKDAIITNFDISKLTINNTSDGAHTVEEVNLLMNKMDFSAYLNPIYYYIYSYDKDFKLVDSKKCTDKENYCNLQSYKDNVKYVKVSYYLDKIIGNNLDIISGHTYDFNTSFINSYDDVTVYDASAYYFYNDDAINVDYAYLLTPKQSHSSVDEKFDYKFQIPISYDYDSAKLYRLDVTYEFNEYVPTEIVIPPTVSYSDITIGGGDVDPPVDPEPEPEDPNKEINDKLNGVNDKLDDLNSSITDSNVDTGSAGGFFNDFEDKDFGLSDIVKAPLGVINSITTGSCEDIEVSLPFVNKKITIPCMMPIYQKHFMPVLVIYQTITGGLISYWICVQLLEMVKGFKDPDKDEIQVVDV